MVYIPVHLQLSPSPSLSKLTRGNADHTGFAELDDDEALESTDGCHLVLDRWGVDELNRLYWVLGEVCISVHTLGVFSYFR